MKPKEIAPRLVVFDFDGVLTDNRVLGVDDGREAGGPATAPTASALTC